MFRALFSSYLILLVAGGGRHFDNYLRSAAAASQMIQAELPEDDSPTPRASDVNADMLRRKLGSDFDPRVMSASEPPPPPEEEEPARRNKGKWRAQVASVLRLVNRIERLPKKQQSRKQRRKMATSWYRKASVCPLRSAWLDVGVRYWPRWIRKGYCGGGCSVPYGMTCFPSATRVVTILRYHCQGITSDNQYCVWIRAKIPVISECRCGCTDSS